VADKILKCCLSNPFLIAENVNLRGIIVHLRFVLALLTDKLIISLNYNDKSLGDV